jgi:hypothetical protein
MKNRILMVILPVVACFAFLPGAPGQLSPPPDGCYPNFTTAEGCNALISLTTGAGNTALGWYSLFIDSTGSFNTGVGAGALDLNNADSNTAVGAAALLLNTTGSENTAVGTDAMVFNTVANDNNAFGAFALFNNDSSGLGLAEFNNAHGRDALQANIDGFQNNAFGDEAMFENISGSFNTAIGDDALFSATGDSNTAIGDEAGANLTTGIQNVYVGAGVSAGDPGEIRFIRIGDTSFTDYDCFIAGINGRNVSTATAQVVFVDDTQKLGTVLVNANGDVVPFKPQAMLDESLKQQKRIAELEATVERQQKGMEVLTAQLKEQAAQIQKVSVQLEMSQPASKVVVNKP